MFQILLISDNDPTEANLKQTLMSDEIDGEITKTAAIDDALKILKIQQFDLVVLDAKPEMSNRLKLLQKLKLYYPAQPVLMLGQNTNRSFALQAMRLNAQGYLTEASVNHEFTDAVKSISLGRSYMTTTLTV